ncbi:MAG: hypothetical protein AAF650_06920 [Pseudomonadota bacterium]
MKKQMLQSSTVAPAGFRQLDNSEIEAVSGGIDNIIVPGTPLNIGGLDPLALLNFQNMQQYAALLQTISMFQGTTQEFPDDDDGTSQLGQLSKESREQILNANEDSEKQEAVEDYLEQVFEQANPGRGDWVFEYDGNKNEYVGIAADGEPVFFSTGLCRS